MAMIDPSQYSTLGLSPNGPPPVPGQVTPQQAFQGQAQSAVGGGQAAMAGGNVAQQTQGADIASKQARSTVDVNQADQLAFIAKVKDQFDKSKGKDGYVSPQLYNQSKQDAAKLNIDTEAFDKTFKDNYSNPNNMYYNTSEMRPIRSTVQEVYNLLKDYHNLSLKGPTEGHLIDVPGVLGMGIGGDSSTYQKNVLNLASSIKGLVGAGQGSGFRFNLQELNRIGALMPTITDTDQQAEQKINELDSLMKTNYGVSIDDLIAADQGATK